MKTLIALTALASSAFAAPFEIAEGDRVMLLGDALLERENTYGALETRMHEQFPKTRFSVRNLAWSGETPKGWSRASFDPPAKGWERLKENIAEVRPTVAILGFGMAASLQEMTDRSGDPTLNADPTRYGAEPMTAARFKKELGELMDAIDQIGNAPEHPKVRFILLAPVRHEDLRAARPGLPDPAPHNALLEQYAKVIEELAKERHATFCPADPKTGIATLAPWSATDNGINLTEQGYFAWTNDVAKRLEWRAPASDANEGVLKGLVNRKNDLFFHQFRPANSTYLFGFRKHEQGKNAAEMPKYTPLIEAVELEINSLMRDGAPKRAGNLAPGDPSPAANARPIAEKEKSERPAPKVLLSILAGPRYRLGTLETTDWNVLSKAINDLAATGEKSILVEADPSIPAGEVKEALAVIAGARFTNVVFAAKAVEKDAPLPPPTFSLADGLELTLWADTDLVGKPVGMNWDAAGRLWVACSPVYPMITPGAHPEDKVVVIEDTDHDGKADKSTTFATDLLIAQGVAPDFGSQPSSGKKEAPAQAKGPGSAGKNSGTALSNLTACYASSSTEFLRLEDTDGNGVADERRIVFSGFGTEDTHHTIHTLRWGPDGRLYFNQSIYIHSHVETPYGMVRLNSGGVFAYDPRTERLEVTARGFINTWGHEWDQWGQEFASDGAGFEGIHWLIPGAMYRTYEGARRILPSISPGSYPKYASLELIQSPLFPADWQGDAITCDFRAHRVVRFKLTDFAERRDPEPAGKNPASAALSGYITKELQPPITTADATFRPIDLKLGPDGALYIADWTNPIINHGEVDFRDPRRDHVHGRIWRLAPKGSTPLKWEAMTGKDTSALLAIVAAARAGENKVTLPDDTTPASTAPANLWSVQNARRVLLSRPEETLQEVRTLASSGMGSTPSVVATSIELSLALGVIAVPNAAAPDAASMAAMVQSSEKAQSPQAVAQFVRLNGEVMARLHATHSAPQERAAIEQHAAAVLGAFARSSVPRVRVEAMRALARIPTVESAALVLEAALNVPGQPAGTVAVKSEDKATSQFNQPTFADTADPYYGYAAWLSVNDLAPQVMEWVEKTAVAPVAKGAAHTGPSRDTMLAYALQTLRAEQTGPLLAKIIAKNGIPKDGSGPWIELIGQAGGPAELKVLYRMVLNFTPECCDGPKPAPPWKDVEPFDFQTNADLRAIRALVEAAKRGVKPTSPWPDHGLTAMSLFLNHPKAEVQVSSMALVGLWKLDSEAHMLCAHLAGNPDPATVSAVFDSLRTLGTPRSAKIAEAFLNPAVAAEAESEVEGPTKEAKPATRQRALGALAAINPAAGLTYLPAVLAEGKGDLLPLWRDLFSTDKFNNALSAKVPTLTKEQATVALRAARELGKRGDKLVAALTPLTGEGAAPGNPQDFAWLVDFTKKNGNAANGELVFRRTALACTVCHAIGGAGGKVGPDLTTIGASAPLDYLVESVMVPGAKVKEGFNAIAVTLKGGRAASGVLARETDREVVIRDAIGTETTLTKADITARENIGSLMPPGLTATITDREKADLFAFLAQLGKAGPFDATKGNVARTWEIFPAKEIESVVASAAKPGSTTVKSPARAFTLVDGRLPKAQLTESLQLVPEAGETILVLARFPSASPSKSRLQMQGATKAWLDGAPLAIASDPNPVVDLAAGNHTLAIKLDVRTLPEVLRAECADVRFLNE